MNREEFDQYFKDQIKQNVLHVYYVVRNPTKNMSLALYKLSVSRFDEFIESFNTTAYEFTGKIGVFPSFKKNEPENS